MLLNLCVICQLTAIHCYSKNCYKLFSTVASNLFVFGGRNEYYSESCIENVIRYDTGEFCFAKNFFVFLFSVS